MSKTALMLKHYMADSINLYDMDWMSGEYFSKLGRFKNAYNIDLSVIFIAAIGIEFMAERIDCLSCEVTGDYYEEFNTYIKEWKIT